MSDTLFSSSAFLSGCLRTLPHAWRASSPRPPETAHRIPQDFLGVCVAASDSPAGDDYLLHALREAGLRDVRLDITYGYREAPQGRLLQRLTAGGFRVWLHLVQPFAEARLLPDPAALERWTLFTRDVFASWKGSAAWFEVGSTCNRRKWTGYRTQDDFLVAWRAALQEARSAGVPLAGVNVTDFEPVYNAGLLEILRRHDLLPAIHSDNLFAERATEPERDDPKIMGPRMAGRIRFNLIRKARLLDAVARAYGIADTVCTHVAWSSRRIRRLLEDADQKQADYLARYLLLAAASGALRRVYWGPFIGQREGLIDDGTAEYPEPIPHVTLYGRAPGDPAHYRPRPACRAMKTLAAFLPGAEWVRALTDGREMEILEFRTAGGGRVHAAWTLNGKAADLAGLYFADDLAQARARDRDGRPIAIPAVLTESPLYLFWDDPAASIRLCGPAEPLRDFTAPHPAGRRFKPFRSPDWTGFIVLPEAEWPADDRLEALLPEALEKESGQDVLRQARNTVWAASHPFAPGERLVVKRACARAWHKRLLSLFQPSKARRSWNAASELERRGVATPAPVAFFERPVRHAALVPSYFVCRLFPGKGSVRAGFTAFTGGADHFDGIPKASFYEALAVFLQNMHERGVFHRDLSAGNVLMEARAGQAVFSVIDTGRARFFQRPLPLSLRLADLKRICHPLSWPEREIFVSRYLAKQGVAFTGLRRLPFLLYDWKHIFKKWIRPLRGR
jgi:hypothetical protein